MAIFVSRWATGIRDAWFSRSLSTATPSPSSRGKAIVRPAIARTIASAAPRTGAPTTAASID